MLGIYKTVYYLREGVKNLLEQGHFNNGFEFRKTQKEALEALYERLCDPNVSDADKVTGYFDIPGGIGKTAMFVSTIAAAYEAAKKDTECFSAYIVVPTTRIFEQTENAFHKFTPEFFKYVGLYGDGNKDLSHPITIMTDVGWVKLTNEGVIGPHTVDALFVDEAHGETSDYRREDIYEMYDGKTALIGYTASPDYDQVKSVLQTHKHCIYKKDLITAVKDNELASYIQAYAYEIRVEPISDEQLKASFNEQALKRGWYKKKLRQTAWSNAVIQIYKDGIDQLTGQLLSNNKTAFYTEDTDHADRLADALNADPVLKQRALDNGFLDVAVSIHTQGMKRLEQKRRMKLVEEGKVMAMVGNKKFEQGLDHPPLKTVFDYQHQSLVKKTQILMRGARKYEDAGLTFIDTIIYLGSDDPKEDKKARKRALRNAVTAHQILGGSYVLGPHAPSPTRALKKYSNYVFKDNKNIKEYVTPETYSLLISEQHAAIYGLEYTIDDVLEAALAYLEENGKRPKDLSGKVQYPPFNGEITWAGISCSKALKDAGYKSLSTLLNQHGIGEITFFTDYTIDNILEAARTYLKEKGKRPTDKSGIISYPPFNGKTKWGNVNSSKVLKGAGYKSLAALLNQYDIGASKGFYYYTIDDVLKAAHSYFEDNGKKPTQYNKTIHYPPFNGKITWSGIGSSKVLKDAGYKSLPDFLDKNDIGKVIGFTNFTIDDALEAVRAYLKDNGKRPLAKNEKIHCPPFNGKTTWLNIGKSKVLRDSGYKSLSDFLNKNDIGKPQAFRNFTTNDVLDAARTYLEDNGKRPTNSDGKVQYPPFNGEITWGGISSSKILKDARYRTLSTLLNQHGIGRSKGLYYYNIDNILEAARSYFEEHGKKPVEKSENISFPPFNGKVTWKSIGQSKVLKDADYKSLSHLLDQNDIGKVLGFTDYIVDDVLEAARSYFEDNDKRPTQRSGRVHYPPFNGKITWLAVNQSTVLKDAGYKSLALLLNQHDIGKAIGFTDYTIDDVLKAARSYLEEHGKRPAHNSVGPVHYPPFNGKVTWGGIGASKVLKDASYKSLSTLLNQHGIGKALGFAYYTTDDVLNAAHSYFQEHGRKPVPGSGKVHYPPFNSKITWAGINVSKVLKDAGYKSLAILLNQHDVGKYYTVDDVLKAACVYFEEHGKKPKQSSGKVHYPPFNGKITWSGVGSSKVLKDAGYNSLADLLDQNDIGKVIGFTDYTVDDVLKAARSYLQEHDKKPTKTSGKVHYLPFNGKVTWLSINGSKVLRGAGYKTLSDLFNKNNIPKRKPLPPNGPEML